MGKPVAFDHLIGYLFWLLREMDEEVRLELTSAAAIEAIENDKRFLGAPFQSGIADQRPASQHRLNVLSAPSLG